MAITVRQKRKGRGNPWHVFIHQNGKIKSKMIGEKKLADVVAAKLRKKLVSGQLNLDGEAAKTPEFGQYAQHYIEQYAKTATKRNTWKGYEIIIRLHLLPVWKGKRLDQIKRADVKKLLLQKQQEGFASGTVENIKALVSGIFTHAYEEELMQTNPALKLGRYIQKQDRRKHLTPLTREQVIKFLETAKAEMPDYYPLLLCAFRTGMRLGELLGLAWEDIDFNSNRIEVRRSYSHGHFATPKSNKSRCIDMSDQLHQTLLSHYSILSQKNARGLRKITLPTRFKPCDVVRLAFPSRTGGPIDGDNIRSRVFYKMLKKAEVPKVRFHDIRHTFASMLLQQGESLHYVKEQMGHASIQTTVDVYGHIVPGSNRNAVNKLDDELKPELRLVTNAS